MRRNSGNRANDDALGQFKKAPFISLHLRSPSREILLYMIVPILSSGLPVPEG
jgi:hypothetical protein